MHCGSFGATDRYLCFVYSKGRDRLNIAENYLTGMPSELCNKHGLSKTLLTRRETIRLKHLMKSLFVYRIFTDEELDEYFNVMQFKGLMSYITFLTNQLRGIYKITREFRFDDADGIVKADKDSMIDLLRMYKKSDPIVVVDFDRTITNKKFHPLYRWLSEEGLSIFINSANPVQSTITDYLKKWDLPMPQRVYANRGKKKKIVQLKCIADKFIERPRFYIDDEIEYLQYGNLLFYHCYQYTSSGRILNKTLCIK